MIFYQNNNIGIQQQMQDNDIEGDKLCFINVRDTRDMIVTIFIIGISVGLVVYTVRVYLQSRKKTKENRPRGVIYFLLILWGIINTCEFIFGMIVQLKGLIYKQNPNIKIYSVINSAIDVLPAFILQGLFIYIPFNIIRNIYTYTTRRAFMLTRLQMYYYCFIKYYQFFRFIRLTASILIFMPFEDEGVLKNIHRIGIWYTVFDALLCTLILMHIQRAISKRESVLIMREGELQMLKKQLLVLNFACFSRWTLDAAGLINATFNDSDSECPNQNYMNTCANLIAGQIFMHFVPIFVIIRMHVVEKETDQSLSSQLSETTQSGQDIIYS